jgi:hypothetical protein
MKGNVLREVADYLEELRRQADFSKVHQVRTLQGRCKSVKSFSRLLDALPAFGECVEEISIRNALNTVLCLAHNSIVAEGIRAPAHKLNWEFEQLSVKFGTNFSAPDDYIYPMTSLSPPT